ncbi:MAG: TnsA endonuclease N-terminal domain-containing protein [Pyrinomonadaceae bacterium]
MAKKTKNDDDINGRGENYTPFLLTHNVKSKGLSTRIQGWKTNRIHHFLSRLELFYFYNLEWFSSIKDIREQFLLNLADTEKIASEIKVKHPGNNKGTTFGMTTDFVITVKKGIGIGEIARTVKPSQELSNERVIEKFEIERIYWESRGIDWGIVSEKEIDTNLAFNIEWIHEFKNLAVLAPLTPEILSQIIPLISEYSINQNITLSELAIACDVKIGLKIGMTLTAIKHLLANRKLAINMHKRINPSLKISEIELSVPD